MDVEDTLRSVMRDHAGEAPTSFSLPSAGVARRRRSWRWIAPLAAAAAIALIATLIVVISSRRSPSAVSSSRPATVADCPASYNLEPAKPWVPALPHGAESAQRLAPLQPPTSAVVCGYNQTAPSASANSLGLYATTVLDANARAALVAQLSWTPPAHAPFAAPCPAMLPGSRVGYLLELRVGEDTEWISTHNGCLVGSTNGVFATDLNLNDVLANSISTGKWVDSTTTLQPCAGFGRLGQEKDMVPSGFLKVYLCGTGPPIPLKDSEADRLAKALNGLPNISSFGGVICDGVGMTEQTLVFTYGVGPPVGVEIIQGPCHPLIDNGNLAADDAGAVPSIVASIAH
jgi:hypothetical protein